VQTPDIVRLKWTGTELASEHARSDTCTVICMYACGLQGAHSADCDMYSIDLTGHRRQYLGSGGCRWAGKTEVSSFASTPPRKASSMFFLVGLLRACMHNIG